MFENIVTFMLKWTIIYLRFIIPHDPFAQNSMKMLFISNVHKKGIHLSAYLYRVSIQKVPQIFIQKVVKIKKINMFPIKTQVKQHMVTQ